jgi:tetratricopeptide (TPR) repeat protein
VANDTAPDVTVTAECLLHLAVGYMYRAQLEKEQIEQEFRAEPEFRNEQVYRAKLEGMRRRNLWQAVASLKQAKSLTPSDVRLSFHLGQVYLFLWDWPGPATKALESALVISPTRVDIAACLALAAAQANIPDVARKAAKCVMERASAALDYNDALANVGRAYETIAEARASSPIQAVSEQAARDSKQAERAKDFRAFRNSIDELLSEQGEAGFESLKKMLSNYKNEKWRLECGHLLAALGTILLKSQLEKAEQTEGLLRNAIEILAKNQPEIDRLGLYRELIHSLRFQERYADAIREAEVAISRQPLEVEPRCDLARIYADIDDWEAAKTNFEKALLLDPDSPRVYFNIGCCYWNAAFDLPDRRSKIASLDNAALNHKKTLDLYGTDERAKIETHFWLGRLCWTATY